jgi:hypothetical protein
MKLFLTAFGLVAILYALVGLYGLWRDPRLFETLLYRRRALTGKLPDNRSNRSLLLWWILLWGAWMALSNSGQVWASLIILTAFLVVCGMILRRRARLPAGGTD